MSDEHNDRLIRIENKLDTFLEKITELHTWKKGHEKAETEFKGNVCNSRGRTIKKLERFQIYIVAGCFTFGVLITLIINWTKLDKWLHGG